MAKEQDRRARTRDAVLQAFATLALERRYDRIGIADLIATTGIGRSTFYEHFAGKHDVLLATLEPVLLALANAASGRASVPVVRMMLDHVWGQRAWSRVILDSAAAPRLRRRLAEMIEGRLAIENHPARPLSLPAIGAAAGQLAMLRSWLAGEVSCSADHLARQILTFGPIIRMDDAVIKDAKTISS